MKIRLGLIGMSEGNGHPYSWSAICNGYDPESMEECGFPAIPRYLEHQAWPEDQLQDVEVSAIWTQDTKRSEHIALCSQIPVVCTKLDDLIDQCDGILLARDDAENHWQFVEPVLKAGKPIYIDKPVALKKRDLDQIYRNEGYPGQVFTCSALRYAQELQVDAQVTKKTGKIHSALGITPKSWAKYGIHVIEPILKLLPTKDKIRSAVSNGVRQNGASCVVVRWESGVETIFHAVGAGPAELHMTLYGEAGNVSLQFKDSFSAFKAALEDFVGGIRDSDTRSPQWFNYRAVEIIERGLE